MSTPKSYTISVPDAQIQRLRQKLELTTFPDELEDAGWDYGAPLADVKRIATYWKDKYDWRKAEAKLNQLPQYTVAIDVDGFEPIDVHFVHQKSSVEGAIPLLFVHGWPGSFLEVTKILPLLADSENNGGPAFHVIAPSLPNFGFSGAVKQKGFGMKQYAETCHKLMLALGYEQYVSQGGDWGSILTRVMGQLYPSAVKASHINMVIASPPGPTAPLQLVSLLFKYATGWWTNEEKTGFERTQWYQKQSQGYYHQQTTKPQTLGYSLADSPVGLLAWIYEKLVEWTDEYAWTDEEVCTWVSIYAFSTAGAAASTRIYYESQKGEFTLPEGIMKHVPKVKLGLSYFPKELVLLPKSWATRMGPIVYSKGHDKGGHFAAWEVPELLVGDLRIMFGKGGGAFSVVPAKNGYT